MQGKRKKHEGDNYTYRDWCLWYSHQRAIEGIGWFGIKGRVEPIQTTILLRTARIPRRVPETWGGFCLSNSSERPSAKTDVKNSDGVNNNNYNTS